MLFSIATLSVFLLAVGDLACGTRTLQVPAAGLHGRRHKARTNAEAIQLGEPLLKPRLVPSRVGPNLRKRASPVLGLKTIGFEDIAAGGGTFVANDYQGQQWRQAIVTQTTQYPTLPTGRGAVALFLNPGPVYDTANWAQFTPIISSQDGSASLRLRSLVCGTASNVAEGASLTVTGSVAGLQVYAVGLSCPAGGNDVAGQLNSFNNLVAVDTISFSSDNGFAGIVDDLVFNTIL